MPAPDVTTPAGLPRPVASPSAAPGAAPDAAAATRPSRRERLHRATLAEIKEAGRAQIATGGVGALSLRAVAREMGLSVSALYRYVDSRDALLTELIVDAYLSLADALEAARDSEPLGRAAQRWLALCRGYRSWALLHPVDFSLIFGTPVPGYEATDPRTLEAGQRFGDVMMGLLAEGLVDGVIDLDRAAIRMTPGLERMAADYLTACPHVTVPRHGVAVGMSAWAGLHGIVMLEVYGHLTPITGDNEALFEAQIRAIMVSIGGDPDLVARL